MTERSYRVECTDCERIIPASADYCPYCGWPQRPTSELRTDGGCDREKDKLH